MFAIKPDSIYHSLPSEFGIKYQEFQVTTIDSLSINVWVFNPELSDSNTQTIVIAGGDAGNMSYLIQYAGNLSLFGFRVVTFDYRGFGKSDKVSFEPNQYYCKGFDYDLNAILDHFYFKHQKKVNLLSFSLGSLVTLNVMPQNYSKVNNIIFDGLIADPNAVIKRANKIKGRNVKKINFNSKLLTLPLNIESLVFFGSQDQYVKAKDIDKFRIFNENCYVMTYPGGHLASAGKLKMIYYQLISDFLQK